MQIEPLKIPAFMRKKLPIRRGNANFYKAPEKLSPPAPSELERPRIRLTSIKPVPSVSIPKAPRTPKPEPIFTPVGVVTHYLDKISVAIIKLDEDVRVGDRLVLNGENGPFRQKLSSMQIDRQNVEIAGRGMDIGIKVKQKTLVGETMYVIG